MSVANDPEKERRRISGPRVSARYPFINLGGDLTGLKVR